MAGFLPSCQLIWQPHIMFLIGNSSVPSPGSNTMEDIESLLNALELQLSPDKKERILQQYLLKRKDVSVLNSLEETIKLLEGPQITPVMGHTKKKNRNRRVCLLCNKDIENTGTYFPDHCEKHYLNHQDRLKMVTPVYHSSRIAYQNNESEQSDGYPGGYEDCHPKESTLH